MSPLGVWCGRREHLVSGRGRVRTISLSTSTSVKLSMTVMQEVRNRANDEGKGIAATKTEDMEAKPSRSQPVLTQESLLRKLPTSIASLDHHALDEDFEAQDDELVGENSRINKIEQVEEERVRFLEIVQYVYKTEKKKLEKILLEKAVATKATARSLVEMERTVIYLETEESLLMNTNEKHFLAHRRQLRAVVEIQTIC